MPSFLLVAVLNHRNVRGGSVVKIVACRIHILNETYGLTLNAEFGIMELEKFLYSRPFWMFDRGCIRNIVRLFWNFFVFVYR